MTRFIWQKAYKGPFGRKEAEALVADLKKVSDPEKNNIYDARVRMRPFGKISVVSYDVYIKTKK